MSVLHIAIQLKAIELIELLLQTSTLDVNIISPQHGTPLHHACKVDSLPIV
jgi:ankyrin repeat protein